MSLPTDYQTFVAVSRYARFLDKEGRRETWEETVNRYFNFMEEHLLERCKYALPKELRDQLEQAMLNLEVMGSMRVLMTAGPALKRDATCAFNCSALPINSPRSFDELFYLLMAGAGVGFSVERQFIADLPIVSEHFEETKTQIEVEDSKAGWARAFKELVAMLYVGQVPTWDTSKVRPAGARLKTFGGRASGPGPLVDLFKYTVSLFKNASGRKLTSIECHDLCCKIASVVVVGGVRRSAMISLSNLSDQRMRDAKTGAWFNTHPDRAFANNSVVYTDKPDMSTFIQEWKALYDSHSGERGIFNRAAAKQQALAHGRRNAEHDWLVNPCGEVLLRPMEKCNLSEVVVRANDSIDEIERKVILATILGTFQSTFTHFKYLRKVWKDNAEEERLLGVSLTGIMDHPILSGKGGPHVDLPSILTKLKNKAVLTNKLWAETLGINQSVAVTLQKPSGTVSQLVDCASGFHARYARYYIRRVRGDVKDPLTQFMKDCGIPCEPCAYKPESTVVFSFPVKADQTTKVFRETYTAIEQLNLWLIYKTYWAEHNVSVTIQVKEHEWLEVGAWVYKNFDRIVGIAFLPYDTGSYVQAPYQEISDKEYASLYDSMPKGIDWNKLKDYEKDDCTVASQEFACTGDTCEVVDLIK